jgi:hypothetical protein
MDCGKMEKNMDLEDIRSQMETFIKVNSLKV